VRSFETPQDPENAAQPGDALVRWGAVLFAAGAVATIATVLPMLVGAEPLPTAFYLASMVMPVGLGLALLGTWRSARARRRPTA